MSEQSPYTVAATVLAAAESALNVCERPVRMAYVAAGVVAWDDCCGMLVAAPERDYRTAQFPLEGPDPLGCYDGLIAVDVVVLCVRCVPVLDDKGRSPTAAALDEAYRGVLEDAAVVWNAMVTGLPDEWSTSGLSQTWVGAEGGCVGTETRITIGVDEETWCPPCPTPGA